MQLFRLIETNRGGLVDELTQKEIDYLVELVENNSIKDWERAKRDLHSDMHRDSIRKSLYVGKYSGYNVYKYMDSTSEAKYTDPYLKTIGAESWNAIVPGYKLEHLTENYRNVQ